MKKGKVLGKSQIIVGVMVMALGAAVWLNMKFSSSEKYLGQAQFVSNTKSEPQVTETAAGVQKNDENYFEEAKRTRQEALTEAQEMVEETLSGAALTQEEKQTALQATADFAKRIEQAQKIETLLKAKDFKEVVAVVGEGEVSVVVKSDGLTTPQTLQIQDIVTTQTKIDLANIKIVAIKE